MTKQEQDEYLKSGFTLDQINEIQEGLDAGLDVSPYAKKEFLAIQMRQIRLGLAEMLPVKKYASEQYDWFQMEEIRRGLRNRVDIQKYADPEITYDRMRQIRLGLEEGVDLHEYVRLDAGILREMRKAVRSKVQIVKYIKKGYNAEQLEQIRLALETGLDIVPYLHKELRGVSIREIRLGLEKGLDVSCYAKVDFSWQQMREIRLGLEHRADISAYANHLYDWQQMREIRLGLESGLDISSYHTLMYTATDMRAKRLKLLQELAGESREIILKNQEIFNHFSVSLSADEMEAFITLNDKVKVTRADVMKALKHSHVTHGIIEEEIDNLIKGKGYNKSVLIARGQPSVEGPAGRYEYFVRTDLNTQCRELPDGSLDFDSVEDFEFIKAGQVFAVYHEAEFGPHGYTVTGRLLPVRKGREKSVLTGKGFLLAKDKRTYMATISGRIEIQGQNVEITQTLVLENVSRSSGNIDFDGCVMVTGDVESETVINATGDVLINGNVEAANIHSDGNVFLRRGANGRGTGSITAGKDIEGRFLESCHIEAGGDIRAASCVNCEIFAGRWVKVPGENGMLAGGITYAKAGLEVQNLGNHAGLVTKIRLGDRDILVRQQDDMDEKIREVERELLIFKNAYIDFQKKYPPEVRNTMEMYLKIENAIFTKEKEMGELLQEKEIMEREMLAVRNTEALVRGTLYENVEFDINGKYWKSKELQNVRLIRTEGRVAVFENS